jgi:hypothetical protein
MCMTLNRENDFYEASASSSCLLSLCHSDVNWILSACVRKLNIFEHLICRPIRQSINA